MKCLMLLRKNSTLASGVFGLTVLTLTNNIFVTGQFRAGWQLFALLIPNSTRANRRGGMCKRPAAEK